MNDKPIQAIDLINYKKQGRKITCLTGYDYRTAQILDQAGIDLILVGDSLANVFLGLKNTYEIGLTEILYHTKAVARAVNQALLVVDMPFLSYNVSLEKAIVNIAQVYQAGAKAIKIEGASNLTLQIIRELKEIGIPIIGHLGYTPQSIGLIGQGRVQGKTEETANKIIQEAKSLEEGGVIAIVLEMISPTLSAQITQILKIPTIGIGAGSQCDGQVLVSDDMFGKSEKKFSFVKKYAELSLLMEKAVKEYILEVREGKFPPK